MNYYDEELQRLQQEMMEKERADAKLADLLEKAKTVGLKI